MSMRAETRAAACQHAVKPCVTRTKTTTAACSFQLAAAARGRQEKLRPGSHGRLLKLVSATRRPLATFPSQRLDDDEMARHVFRVVVNSNLALTTATSFRQVTHATSPALTCTSQGGSCVHVIPRSLHGSFYEVPMHPHVCRMNALSVPLGHPGISSISGFISIAHLLHGLVTFVSARVALLCLYYSGDGTLKGAAPGRGITQCRAQLIALSPVTHDSRPIGIGRLGIVRR